MDKQPATRINQFPRLSALEEIGNTLIKLVGTYEVVIWRLLALYIAIRHFLGI
jgi:hypothetical protein